MTTPQVPSFGASVATVARLSLLRHVRGRKLRLAGATVLVVVVAAIAARVARPEVTSESAFRDGIGYGFFRFLVYLVPFLFQAGAIGEEVEARTFPFLAARPLNRFALTLGKFLAGALLSTSILAGAVLVLYVGCFATSPSEIAATLPLLARCVGALSLLGLAYGAISLLFGALAPDAGGVLGIVYLGLVEFLGATMPFGFRLVSLNFHAAEAAGLERGGLMAERIPTLPTYASLGIVGVATLVALVVAGAVVASREYRFSQS